MDFALSEEQTAIFDMARAFGEDHIRILLPAKILYETTFNSMSFKL